MVLLNFSSSAGWCVISRRFIAHGPKKPAMSLFTFYSQHGVPTISLPWSRVRTHSVWMKNSIPTPSFTQWNFFFYKTEILLTFFNFWSYITCEDDEAPKISNSWSDWNIFFLKLPGFVCILWIFRKLSRIRFLASSLSVSVLLAKFLGNCCKRQETATNVFNFLGHQLFTGNKQKILKRKANFSVSFRLENILKLLF